MTTPEHDFYRLLDWICIIDPALRQALLAEATKWTTALTPATPPPSASTPTDGSAALYRVLQNLLEQAAAQDALAAGHPQVAVLPRLEPCPQCGQTGLGQDNIVVDGTVRYAVHSFDCPHCGWIDPAPRQHHRGGDFKDAFAASECG